MSPKPGRKPYLPPDEKRKPMSVCFSPSVREWIEAEAARTGQSMSAVIEAAVVERMNGGR